MISDRCLSCLSVCPVCLSVLSVTLMYSGQTVGWIKMKLGMQVGLCPGHIVLDGDSAHPPPKGYRPPIFGPHLLWPNGWGIKMPLGMGVGLGPGDFVLDGNPASPPQKGAEPPPNFRPMSIVAKRLDGSRWHLAERWASVQVTVC